MIPRREFLFGVMHAAALGLGGLSAACSKPRTARTSVHAGVDFTELVPKTPDDSLPLVVAIHGEGGAPEHWVEGWTPFPGNARILLPRGFDKHEEGFSWFPWSTDMKSEKLATEAGAAEERLWKGVADFAAGRRVVVAGYIQGAMLSFVMASRHPDVIAGAFSVIGACPDAFLPKNKARAAPLFAYHGIADEVLPIQATRDAIAAFKREGNEATLREYAGVRHSATDGMHEDLRADMQKSLSRRV